MRTLRTVSMQRSRVTLSTGNTYGVLDASPGVLDADPVTLLCVHGFPDTGHGWRHQVGPWMRAGFRVIVPDMLGYGSTDAPVDPAQYTTKRLCSDLAACSTPSASRAPFSVPYTPPARSPTPLVDVARRAPNLAYQLYLASPAAAPEIEANLHKFLTLTYHPPGAPTDFTAEGALRALLAAPDPPAPRPCLLVGPDLDHYLTSFRTTGFTGPTNYYRTTALRYAEESAAALPVALPVTLSVLFLYGTADPTVAPAALRQQRRFVPRLTERALEGRGHWVMIEDAAEGEGGDGGEVGRAVLQWLAREGIGAGRTKL
ncbi:Alpha/Beta hydrolase protein [Mycena sp. CBHHK59/15]|nr:Alpha/Beta hydrolase protein [Mycena sp. CBHHK59/15]